MPRQKTAAQRRGIKPQCRKVRCALDGGFDLALGDVLDAIVTAGMISSPATRLAALPEAARLIGRRLGQALRPDAIFLFGSHARGDAGPDSDLDFMVVVPESPHPRYLRSVEARRIVGDIFSPKDIVVLTRQEWEAERRVVCSLASTVLREGVRLHG